MLQNIFIKDLIDVKGLLYIRKRERERERKIMQENFKTINKK